MLRRVTFACVSIDSGSLPASPSTSDSAIVKQPACAAAISSSGVVPLSPSPKRESKEYLPSKAPESSYQLAAALLDRALPVRGGGSCRHPFLLKSVALACQ